MALLVKYVLDMRDEHFATHLIEQLVHRGLALGLCWGLRAPRAVEQGVLECSLSFLQVALSH